MPYEKSDIAKQVEQEHACLKRDLADIKRDMMKAVKGEAFGEWRLEFMWRLRDFRVHLLKHFDLEEEGGFMAEILSEAPEAMGQVEKLETEHQEIITTLDGILADMKKLERNDEEKLEKIRTRVLELVSTVHAHEAAENELILTMSYQEYGYPGAS